jgi:hypothetical protein
VKKCIQISLVLTIIAIISACNIRGEDVFVYTSTTKSNETLKVNAISEYDQTKKLLHIKAIIDIYDKDKKYKKTIMYVIKGNIEEAPSISHEDGPLTILTDRTNTNLTDKDKKRIRDHVLSHTNKIK